MNKSFSRRALMLGATTALITGLTVQKGFAAFVEPTLPVSVYTGPHYKGKGIIALEQVLKGQIDLDSVAEIVIGPGDNSAYLADKSSPEDLDMMLHLLREKTLVGSSQSVYPLALNPSVWELLEA